MDLKTISRGYALGNDKDELGEIYDLGDALANILVGRVEPHIALNHGHRGHWVAHGL